MGSMVMTLVLAGSFSALSQGTQMAGQARSEQFVDQLVNSEIQFLKTLNWESFDDIDKVYVPNSTAQYLMVQAKGSDAFSVEETQKLFTGQNFTKKVSGSNYPIVSRNFFNNTNGIPVRNLTLSVNSINHYDGQDREKKTLEYTFSWEAVDGRQMSRTVEFAYCKNGIHDSFVPSL